jgi:hypothetical protein
MTLLSDGVFDVGVMTSAMLLISELATSSVMLLLLIGRPHIRGSHNMIGDVFRHGAVV